MANSSTVTALTQKATAEQYNNLRKDVLDTSSGHKHDGSNGYKHTDLELVITGNIDFDAGAAVTATKYSIGRDADGTNQLHFNVPTGAGYEWSVNDTAVMTLTSSGLFPAVNVNVNNRFIQLEEISDPAAPSGDRGRLYTKDNGSGKTQLVVRFNTGAVQVIATEP